MTLQSDTYYSIKCNAAIDNLLHPVCQAVSAGGFNDKIAVLESALKLGWTENGGRHMCPEHSKVSVAAPAKTPSRRAQRAAASDDDTDPPAGS